MIQGYTLATFPKVTQYIYAQPEKKQAKELCSRHPLVTVTVHGVELS